MSELNDSLLDLGLPLIEYSIRCVWDANCDQCHLNWSLTSLWTYCWDRRMEDERKKGWLERCRWVKKRRQSRPAVFSVCMLCVFMQVARFCVLYAFCCFLPSRSPAMGNLIKVLGKDLENCPHFFLDFESKWAPGCVRVSVCLKCESTCVQRRCSVGGRWVGSREVYLDVSCWVVDGVVLWVWFVIIRRSLVPLSLLSDAPLTNDGTNIQCVGTKKTVWRESGRASQSGAFTGRSSLRLLYFVLCNYVFRNLFSEHTYSIF